MSLSDTQLAGKLASVDLIPWDPDSTDHVQRMVQQRVACGWNHDHVEAWRGYQRDGKLGLYWIVSTFSQCDTILACLGLNMLTCSRLFHLLTQTPIRSFTNT
jgi:hypothetical protein